MATSFRSRFFPQSSNGLVVQQEYAMFYYGVFTAIVMVGVMMLLFTGGSGRALVGVGVGGEILALVLGNIFGGVKLRKRIAEVFFVNTHFSLISVHDILSKQKSEAFPLAYANPVLSGDRITLHYHDQIVTLEREDWDEFDLIWDWLNAQPRS